MKTRWIAAALGAGLLGTLGQAFAQPYGGSGYGRGNDDRGGGYGDRRGYDDRGPRRREYDEDGGSGGRQAGFNEREYLRCNADVRQALQNGTITGAYDHYRAYGIRERRRLTC